MALPRYDEKIRWPLWLWFFFAFLLGSLSLAVWAAVGTTPAVEVSLVELALLITFYIKSALVLRINDGWIFAGKAKIETSFIASVIELDGVELRKVRGPQADPASFLAIRFWVTRAIKIEIDDPRDSTPYWLISTRHPDKMASALRKPVEI